MWSWFDFRNPSAKSPLPVSEVARLIGVMAGFREHFPCARLAAKAFNGKLVSLEQRGPPCGMVIRIPLED